jgi:hypothetical protein
VWIYKPKTSPLPQLLFLFLLQKKKKTKRGRTDPAKSEEAGPTLDLERLRFVDGVTGVRGRDLARDQ